MNVKVNLKEPEKLVIFDDLQTQTLYRLVSYSEYKGKVFVRTYNADAGIRIALIDTPEKTFTQNTSWQFIRLDNGESVVLSNS